MNIWYISTLDQILVVQHLEAVNDHGIEIFHYSAPAPLLLFHLWVRLIVSEDDEFAGTRHLPL